MKLRVLSAAEVRQALPMSDAIEAMRRAYGQLSANQVDMPLRTRLQTDQGLVLLMPAFLRQSRELGFKMVSIWGDNPAKGLPAVIAIALVLDPDTGLPQALINGEELTAIRTGAGGGLATDLLAWSYPRQTRFAKDMTKEIADLTKRYPGRIYGLADYDPFDIKNNILGYLLNKVRF